MEPRTKKGPSWANEAQPDPPPVTSEEKTAQDVDMEQASNDREEGLSDLDWMRRRMSKTVDVVDKAYEQSDDEGEEPSNLVRALLKRFATANITFCSNRLPLSQRRRRI